MTLARYLLRRTALAVFSVYASVSLTFAVVAFAPNTALGGRLSAASYYERADAEEVAELQAAYLEARGLDDPLVERYLDWLVDIASFDWGFSFVYNQPVWDVLVARVPTTFEYVVPGVLLAVALGVPLGAATAMVRSQEIDLALRLATYVLVGLPGFMFVAFLAFGTGGEWKEWTGVYVHRYWVNTALPRRLVAAMAVAASLLGAQIRFARTAVLEEAGKEFVKLLRAKGASRLRVGRHVLRNAALPIVTLSATELLSVLLLNIYVVEDVLRIDGLAGASLMAVRRRDFPLIIGTTMVLVFVGVLGSLLQDVCYGYLDPRVETE
ncbi:ABC transporter permease [Halobacterium rubrum]|uniref:ABC transporter permease n=1 Tax=Halobacterium TaxID=2239 RepID=UPI001F39AC6A|nr:ABC transporter permease [Halobacterium rubrum]MDH5021201.1 ABC transporter permease [Halobacterium rubrum]